MQRQAKQGAHADALSSSNCQYKMRPHMASGEPLLPSVTAAARPARLGRQQRIAGWGPGKAQSPAAGSMREQLQATMQRAGRQLKHGAGAGEPGQARLLLLMCCCQHLLPAHQLLPLLALLQVPPAAARTTRRACWTGRRAPSPRTRWPSLCTRRSRTRCLRCRWHCRSGRPAVTPSWARLQPGWTRAASPPWRWSARAAGAWQPTRTAGARCALSGSTRRPQRWTACMR